MIEHGSRLVLATVSLAAMALFVAASPASAVSPPPDFDDGRVEDYPSPTTRAWITNLETGGTVSFEVEVDVLQAFDDIEPSAGYAPLADSGDIKGSQGATAQVVVNYDRSGNGAQIRVNRVWGSWTSSTPLLTVFSNREVHYGDQPAAPPGGHSASRYPTGNTFDYTTGWGWATCYPPTSQFGAAGAATFVDFFVSGLPGTFSLQTRVQL